MSQAAVGVMENNRKGVPMIPARFAPVLSGFLLSGLMSLMVSGIATLKAVGLTDGLLDAWMQAWSWSWLIGFPVVLGVAPITRWTVDRLTKA